MPSVGGYSVITLDGSIQLSAILLRPVRRDGVDGIAYLDVGYTHGPFAISTMQAYNSAPALGAAQMDFANLVGSLVTVVDTKSRSWYYLMVLGVEFSGERIVKTGVGDLYSKLWMFRTKWTLQPTALYYGYPP